MILQQLQPMDLLKDGLIPELVGRLPITVAVDYLDEADIIRILTEPKNAFVKHYQKFFALGDVQLVFEPPALTAIARKALQRGTGARGLKSIIEDLLLNAMFEVPSRPEVTRCVITEKTVLYATELELDAETSSRRSHPSRPHSKSGDGVDYSSPFTGLPSPSSARWPRSSSGPQRLFQFTSGTGGAANDLACPEPSYAELHKMSLIEAKQLQYQERLAFWERRAEDARG